MTNQLVRQRGTRVARVVTHVRKFQSAFSLIDTKWTLCVLSLVLSSGFALVYFLLAIDRSFNNSQTNRCYKKIKLLCEIFKIEL